MKIAICFFGVLHGNVGRDYDIKHCWPNLSRMIVQPFKEKHTKASPVIPIRKEHQVEILLSTYKVDNEVLEKEIYDMIKPDHVQISAILNSSSKTTKLAMFKLLENKDYDFVIMTRTDLHFSETVIDKIDFNKFNFLFHENTTKAGNLTCDNFYAWPYKFTEQVKKSFETCPQLNSHDTHKLFDTLSKNISVEDICYIAAEEKYYSDVNKYFTICKRFSNDRIEHGLHEEVMERFNIK
jgi:hypothetical protein